jgi:hypothetical protein
VVTFAKKLLTLREKAPSFATMAQQHTPFSEGQKYTSQQAVMERVCDEKSGERRGDQLKMTTPPIACFRNTKGLPTSK